MTEQETPSAPATPSAAQPAVLTVAGSVSSPPTHHEIRHRYSRAVLWSGDARDMRHAAEQAHAGRANLGGAYLGGAYLGGANLVGARGIAGATGCLAGFGWHVIQQGDAAPVLRFGCEAHPLADWTPELIADRCRHHALGDERMPAILTALVALAKEVFPC